MTDSKPTNALHGDVALHAELPTAARRARGFTLNRADGRSSRFLGILGTLVRQETSGAASTRPSKRVPRRAGRLRRRAGADVSKRKHQRAPDRPAPPARLPTSLNNMIPVARGGPALDPLGHELVIKDRTQPVRDHLLRRWRPGGRASDSSSGLARDIGSRHLLLDPPRRRRNR